MTRHKQPGNTVAGFVLELAIGVGTVLIAAGIFIAFLKYDLLLTGLLVLTWGGILLVLLWLLGVALLAMGGWYDV